MAANKSVTRFVRGCTPVINNPARDKDTETVSAAMVGFEPSG